MKVREIAALTGAQVLTGEAGLDREVVNGYASDLLSWVMAHGSAGMAWVTVQTHMNVIAVAALHEMSCVILAENAKAAPEVVAKAAEEGIAVLASAENTWKICGTLYTAGIGA